MTPPAGPFDGLEPSNQTISDAEFESMMADIDINELGEQPVVKLPQQR